MYTYVYTYTYIHIKIHMHICIYMYVCKVISCSGSCRCSVCAYKPTYRSCKSRGLSDQFYSAPSGCKYSNAVLVPRPPGGPVLSFPTISWQKRKPGPAAPIAMEKLREAICSGCVSRKALNGLCLQTPVDNLTVVPLRSVSQVALWQTCPRLS